MTPCASIAARTSGSLPIYLRDSRRGREPYIGNGYRNDVTIAVIDCREPHIQIPATKDGAFMEPRGCNRWQSVANLIGVEAAQTSEIRCYRLPPVA
jgi:hypothetical protein